MVPWSVLPSVSNKPKQPSFGRDFRSRYNVEENSKLMNEDKMNLTRLFQLPSSRNIKQVSETAKTNDQDDKEYNLMLTERKEKLEVVASLGRKSKTAIKVASPLKYTSKKITKTTSKSTNLHLNSGPHWMKMLYNGKHVELSPEYEEVATMFAVMKDTEFAAKPKFINNFMKDLKAILGKQHIIKEFHLCALKEEKLKQEEKYIIRIHLFLIGSIFGSSGTRKKPDLLTALCPILNERWKKVKHDNTVTWLAFWKNPIDLKAFKYVFLDDTSYSRIFKKKDPMKQQIVVATYRIDMLALRAGNEKDDDEADTFFENISLVPQTNKLEIMFPGKDSIKYENTVKELFDKLDTYKLNVHLKDLMSSLTTKVFHTYNESITLDKLLNSEIMGGNIAEKVVVYNRANKEVAKLCNHQHSEPKENIVKLKGVLDGLETDMLRVIKGKAPLQMDVDDGKPNKNFTPKLQRKIKQTLDKIGKTEHDMDLKKELNTTALGTSKTNYLDPRILFAWCKRHIFNKSLLAKFP
ncbi:hypothetical protein MKX01_035950 [Papaver californicum]|nr:hypothetical protein MKX01_035950 [Papaver californicum]